ncbi:MAG: hypothetical protein RL238_902 [Actinomycetota bacterium]
MRQGTEVRAGRRGVTLGAMDRRSFLSLSALGIGAGLLSACGGGESGSSGITADTTPDTALLAGRSFAVRRDPG